LWQNHVEIRVLEKSLRIPDKKSGRF